MTGHEIKELRKALKWSQMKFANEIGCHLSTIQKLEGRGELGKASPLLERSVMDLVIKIEKSKK